MRGRVHLPYPLQGQKRVRSSISILLGISTFRFLSLSFVLEGSEQMCKSSFSLEGNDRDVHFFTFFEGHGMAIFPDSRQGIGDGCFFLFAQKLGVG